ncbi:PREDICTED: indole-3-acetaldehyde oxidase-like [Papilio xuthus]|uniref:Indole-3-acetaldehyde oxidase-like n=1 Tax=Papilio xuthus TaxID=66420 RepID=A0AAJ6YZX5_PAPXU|nr:PREDICTED: indole-3-acetaldehyde oxidase-like [Papilio xuthus]
MDRIWFAVNGVRYSVGSEVDSTTTLLDYLRSSLHLFGTKYMCREAGCGACIVSAVRHPGAPHTSINACMVSITSCQNWEITTIECLGDQAKGYNKLQQQLAKDNGSQCGYCSPSWIMTMYSLLKSKPDITRLEIEKSLSSNICRCTGYRPILDAFKKFGSDAADRVTVEDIEDLHICSRTGNACKGSCDKDDWCIVTKDDIYANTVKHIVLHDNRDWYSAETVSEIFDILKTKGNKSYMLVAGNTAKGVYPITEYPLVLIDVNNVSQLKTFVIDQNLVIGAGLTITEVIEIFKTVSQRENFSYLLTVNEHLEKVAHVAVRNIATLAGNLVIKHRNPEFQSDIFLLLETVGAQVTIAKSKTSKTTLNMQDFLKQNLKGKIIINVMLPPLNKSNKIVTYKIAPRAQNAHAIVNAGFLYDITSTGKVSTARITYGGLSPAFTRATNTEMSLIGKTLFDNATLQLAIQALVKELVVTENPPEPSVAYRKHVAISLFYKGLLSFCPPSILSSQYQSGGTEIHDSRQLSSGRQSFDTDPSLWPLNQPVMKLEATIQCSGEAHYVEDIPPIPKEVFASFVLSTVPLGTLESIDASEALKQPGVIAFYSAKDIPGVNSFTPAGTVFYETDEELLCAKEIKYFNQAIGIIVAETRYIADVAAKLVTAKYSNVQKPVLDIKKAKDDSSRRTLYTTHAATDRGTDVCKKITGENTIYGQYHFSMETLVCVSKPTEQGIKVHPASQWIDGVQMTTSRALNLQENCIDVYVRRIGGAFGIKISRSNQVAVACNMVVQKLKRPCRFIQSLTTNMRTVGKRLPCTITFEVEVDGKGAIQYLKYDLYEDNGYIVNEPFIMIGDGVYNNCYRASRWDYVSYNCITDTASNSWCRSPGSLEAIVMAENIMERISYEMSADPLQVRLSNLDTDNYKDLLEMIDTVKESSDYTCRRLEVDKFNEKNRWKKRGLRFSLMRWAPSGGPIFVTTLSVYHDDGTVDIVHSGVEMGQGINTKAAQVCAYFLKIPLNLIKIKPNNTMIACNGFITGGSLASMFTALGVERACKQLLERLQPIREQLGNPTWQELIVAAHDQNVNLQAHGFVSRKDIQDYNIYGVAVTEVEVDILTGQSEVIRVDLLEDAGISVNQEVDVGQVEGAFVMGLGYWTSEQLVYDPKTGENLTNRTWNYFVPQARDIPQDFRISFRKNSQGPSTFLGSKAIGEPPLCLSVGVTFAMREAITSARSDGGISSSKWFQIDGPWTVERICLAADTKYEDFKFN